MQLSVFCNAFSVRHVECSISKLSDQPITDWQVSPDWLSAFTYFTCY